MAINSETSSALVGTTCMELALEGERLCKTGDFENGIRFLEEAKNVGTSDDRTMSAIYSQLGNAYFYVENYLKALEYHKKDVELVRKIKDEIAEAKACGNLGNTFKMLSKFDEAAKYCERYLEISRKLNDRDGEGKALYNLGNVYHTQGKCMIGSNSKQEQGELSLDIKSSLNEAIKYYELNLEVVSNLRDFTSMGRAYGNLGNTHYLLGNFERAVECHKERLALAQQTNDKSAERRAHLNLGNAYVFLGKFHEAIEHYKATLDLAQELQDRFTEAHSCYSLANTYTFLRDYKSAINYHLKYLDMILMKEFEDKPGEGRACWSLVNIYQMVNDPESALIYAERHYAIAEQLGDKAGLASAKLNIQELKETIAQKQAAQTSHHPTSSSAGGHSGEISSSHGTTGKKSVVDNFGVFRLTPDKRQEQEQRRFKKQLNSNLTVDIDGLVSRRRPKTNERGVTKSSSSERLFDMIAHFQSGRIDDQRCEILKNPSILPNEHYKSTRVTDDKENQATNSNIGAAAGSRGAISRGSQPSIGNPLTAVSAAASAIKATYRKASLVSYPTSIAPSLQSQRRPTVSAEHRDQLFDLIAGAQGKRMDEQRAALPAFNLPNGVLRKPINPAQPFSSGNAINRVPTATKSVSSSQNPAPPPPPPSGSLPETIFENRTTSHRPLSSNLTSQTTVSIDTDITRGSSATVKPKLNRRFQTVDSDSQVHDEKFLDSLMKYQSTRFNDQRSEIPSSGLNPQLPTAEKGQADNFFNLIVRFQSDRIDDQRSSPPALPKNK